MEESSKTEAGYSLHLLFQKAMEKLAKEADAAA